MHDKEKLLAGLQEYYNQIERMRNRKARKSKQRYELNDLLKRLSDSIEVIEMMEM